MTAPSDLRSLLTKKPAPSRAALLAALAAAADALERAENELLCIRGWVENDWALDCANRPTAKAVLAMYAKLNDDARRAEAALAANLKSPTAGVVTMSPPRCGREP